MEWAEQVALVTGGARGIGRAIAVRLARQGAAVCVNFRSNQNAAHAVVREIEALGGRVMAVPADVADDAAVEAMIDRIDSHLGGVSILVNNAGLSLPATLDNYDREQMARMRQVNVDGVIHATRAVASGMRRRGYGRIVNVSSIAGIGTALPNNTFYAATKAEVNILTQRFAMELGPHGITVNAVAPGFIETEMTRKNRGGEWENVAARIGALAMMGRIGRPEDIANAVAFLAAPDSSWITAQVLTVDGGRMDYIAH